MKNDESNYLTMTQEQFNDHIMEYEARLVLLAKEQWYELLVTHSLLDPVTEDVYTGWHGDIANKLIVPYMAMKQVTYIHNEIMQ